MVVTMPDFPVEYDEILKRVDAIDPEAYAVTRNFTDGAVTYLSPYISRGVITLRQIIASIQRKGYKLPHYIKFIQQLAWREYFQRVWQEKRDLIDEDLKQKQTDILHDKIPEAIVQAATGIKAVDDFIRQLYSTGYMHNHCRMYIASIACNIGRAHWKMPSNWLYYHLLDGDVASNNCSWQWVSGAFSSKKYYCNQENINKYSRSNQSGTFLDESYERLQNMDVPRHLITAIAPYLKTTLPVTGLPSIDSRKPTLIYNSYNLDPLWRREENFNRILLLEPSHFRKYPVSDKVLDFIISLSGNIEGIKICCGEFRELETIYKTKSAQNFIYKEHPAFLHYEGIKDSNTWMFEKVEGFFPSFSKYWNQCMRHL